MQNTKTTQKRLIIDIPATLHYELKKRAAEHNTTIKKCVLKCLLPFLKLGSEKNSKE